MKKIDAHLHLVRDLASYKGNSLVVWDNGFKTRLFSAGWLSITQIWNLSSDICLSQSPVNWLCWKKNWLFWLLGQISALTWLEDSGIFLETELADIYYGN